MAATCGDFGGIARSTGKPCGRAAGQGTDHVGDGKCSLHGGAALKGPAHPNWVHGGRSRYKHLAGKRIGDLIAEFEQDPEPLNILPELAVARALLSDYLERLAENREALLAWHEAEAAGNDGEIARPSKILDPAGIRALLSEITKIVKRIEDIRAQRAVTIATFFRVMTEVGRAVDEEVPDEEARARVRARWEGIRQRMVGS